MRKPLGIGIIGMGWMGMVHSRAHRMIPDRFGDGPNISRLVICADEIRSRTEQAKQIAGFESATIDWQEVVEHPEVETVIITSPNYLHLRMIEAAAVCGKHVFCEKPVGSSPYETLCATRVAEKNKIVTGVGYNYRWAPVVQFVRELINRGELGDITHYRGRFFVDYASNPDGVLSWRFDRKKAGTGVLADVMSHVVDMAHMLVGPIREVVSSHKTWISDRPVATPGEGDHFSVQPEAPREPVTNEDDVSALVSFQCGAHGQLEVSRVAKGARCDMSFEIFGTRGHAKWNFETMNELSLYLPDGSAAHNGPVRIQACPEHPYYGRFYPGPANSMSYEDLKVIEAYHFSQSVAESHVREPDFGSALRVAEVFDAIERSWTSRTWEPVQIIKQELN